jgi:inorganic pyrophosphatase
MAEINGIDTVKKAKTNPLFTFPVGDEFPNEINMLVEIPKGSINKYEYVTNTGTLKLDRVLYEQIPYPIEYGAIPQTWDEDEDMLDVMSLVTYPTFPGCLISVRPIGVMLFDDGGEVDDKILAVPADDVRFKHIQDIGDVSDHSKDEIGFFFEYYKVLQRKYKDQSAVTEVKEWQDKSKAIEIIERAMDRFKDTFKDQI